MHCDDARRHWSLYHDSEGDRETCFEISEHLDGCAACAEWFHEQSRLEELIEARMRAPAAHGPTPELWNAALARSGIQQPTTALARRWVMFGGVLALAASLLMMTFLWGPRAPNAAHLATLTADYHTRLAVLGQPVDYESGSDLAVEDYLRERVSFPVRCPPRKDSGFLVRGAGVCRIDKSEAAYLVGRVADTDVSIFILPGNALAGFPLQQQALAREAAYGCREGDYQMVMATMDQSVVLVIGRADEARLRAVLKAYGSYPEHV